MTWRHRQLAPASTARRLRLVRQMAGLTQYQLAERSGVSVQTIIQIELGWGGLVAFATMLQLADGLCCSLDVLTDRDMDAVVMDALIAQNGLQDWLLLGMTLSPWERRLTFERYANRPWAGEVPGRLFVPQGAH